MEILSWQRQSGASVSELLTKSIWFQGPGWIGTELIDNISSEMPTECMQELRVSDKTCSLLVSGKSLKQVIDLKRYSNLERLQGNSIGVYVY